MMFDPTVVRNRTILSAGDNRSRRPHFFFFWWVGGVGGTTTRPDYLTNFQPSQSLGGAKAGIYREKLPDHTQAEIGLSHI